MKGVPHIKNVPSFLDAFSLILREMRRSAATADIFQKTVKRVRTDVKRRASAHKDHNDEFGVQHDALVDPDDLEGGGELRPVFTMLDDLIRQKSPLIVITSAVAIAEDDYEQTIHQNDGHADLDLYCSIEPRVKLWPHQEEAVRFLKAREDDEAGRGTRGWMLCDDMGLGKTLDALVFILRDIQRLYRETRKRFNGVTLLVVPKIVAETWITEIEQSFPPNTLHCVKMLGDRDHVPDLLHMESCVDIILTTYPVVSLVYKSITATEYDDGMVEAEQQLSKEDAHRYRVLFDLTYRRVVTDEAQEIVNRNTSKFHALNALKSRANGIMTGRPIQNSPSDMYTCLDFIRVPGLCEHSVVTKQDKRELREIRDWVMLRRLKQDIPASLSLFTHVDTRVELIDFDTPQERALYSLYAEHAQDKMRGKVVVHGGGATNGEKNMNMTSIIQYMRQCCIDFRVLKKPILPNGMLTLAPEGTTTRAGLPLKPTSFNECLFYSESQHYKHIDKDNREFEKKAFRLNRRSCFQYRHQANGQKTRYMWDPYGSSNYTENDEEYRLVYRAVYTMLCESRQQEYRDLTLDEVLEAFRINAGDTIASEEDEAWLAIKPTLSAAYEHLMRRALPLYATKPRRIIRYILEEIEDPSDKVIIFSDSVVFLKRMARYLEDFGLSSCLVTGESAKSGQNEGHLRRFQSDESIRCLLMSLKVGNMGLNIQCANHIIFVSCWWNPSIDLQAERRAQRPGQKKEVHIRYFILKNSIEEYVLDVSQYKQNISHHLIENTSDEDNEEMTRKCLFDCIIKVKSEEK